jgi:hypothetical protein
MKVPKETVGVLFCEVPDAIDKILYFNSRLTRIE